MTGKIIRITTVATSLDKLLQGQLRYMTELGYEIVAVAAPEPLLQRVGEREGIRTWACPMTRRITPLKDLLGLFRLIMFFRRERPQIVHTHTPKAGLLGMLAAAICRVPHRLHTVAGLPLVTASGIEKILLTWSERLTARCATALYPNSADNLAFMIRHRLAPADKMKVIGAGSSNGVDSERFQYRFAARWAVRRDLGIGDQDWVFIFVGRLVPDKGIGELFTAFSEVCQKQPCHLIMVGEIDAVRDRLPRKTLRKIREHPRIHEIGYSDSPEEYLCAADCLVLPSYREGFPRVILEAAACALPSITTDAPGCREAVIPRQSGWIVRVGSSVDLRRAMADSLSHPDISRHYGRQARQQVLQLFQQETIWDQIAEEYRQALQPGSIRITPAPLPAPAPALAMLPPQTRSVKDLDRTPLPHLWKP